MNGLEGIDYVRCRVCGFEGFSLNRHIAKHDLTAETYVERYPDARMMPKVIVDAQALKVSGPRKPPRELVCTYCGGRFNHRENLWMHLKREKESYLNGVEGVEYITCRICGLRTESLGFHLQSHGESRDSYCVKFPGSKMVIEKVSDAQSAAGAMRKKETKNRVGATFCDKCGEWYLHRLNAKHLQDCVAAHPDKYVEGRDFVKCPECQSAMSTRLGEHLQEVHGWDKDRIALEVGRGMKLMADNIRDKIVANTDFKSAQIKREQTHLDRHGFINPFSDPAIQDKIVETNQRRYGVDHPMKNEEIFTRQQDSAQNGPSAQEVFFDEHTCDSVVYTGFGGRFVRTKTGVRKYGRVIKDLNPDFMVFPDNVLESARMASKERRKLSSEKHRTKYVIELLGDWYHSEGVIGVKPEEHEAEVIAAYKSVGIECLVLWEKDVMERWNEIEPRVSAWIANAVKDINEHPVWRKTTRSKVDGRIATLECPYGSGRKFKSQRMLDGWVASPINYWRPGLVAGKDYVVCMECGGRASKLAEHLRKSHGGMKKEEYLGKHPGALMVAERVGEMLRQHAGPRGPYKKRTAM